MKDATHGRISRNLPDAHAARVHGGHRRIEWNDGQQR
jgi:hypothetical protein